LGNANVNSGNNATGSGDGQAGGADSNTPRNETASDKWAFWIMLATGLNAFAALIYGVVSIFQLCQMRKTKDQVAKQARIMIRTLRQIKRQANDTHDIANHNKDAVGAMKDQADKMGQSIIISNRASVGIHSIEYNKETGMVLVNIENIGLVPAKKIAMYLEIVLHIPLTYALLDRDATGARRFLRFRLFEKDFGSTHLLRGNLQITRSFLLGTKLRQPEADFIDAGVSNFVVDGYVAYEDGFTGQERQRSDFLFFYEAKGDFWTADDPLNWQAVFNALGVADNEKEENEQFGE